MIDYLQSIWLTVQLHWIMISAFLILISAIYLAVTIMIQALNLSKKIKKANIYHTLWTERAHEDKRPFKNKILFTLSLHIGSFLDLSIGALRRAVWTFIGLSLFIGVFTGYTIVNTYMGWSKVGDELPYNSFNAWLPVAAGVFAGLIPFLIMFSFIQSRRGKLSHQLLPYIEEFETQYLVKRNIKSALDELLELIPKGTLQDLTSRLIHCLQRQDYERIELILRIFENQVGSKFAMAFCVLIREGTGLTTSSESRTLMLQTKDIRMGLRSIIQKMHGQKQVQEMDKPKKRDIRMVGYITLPLLYGVWKMVRSFLADENQAKHFLFEIPSQMNIFVIALIAGFTSITLNIIFGKRKLDL
jgi:hypothetical protein